MQNLMQALAAMVLASSHADRVMYGIRVAGIVVLHHAGELIFSFHG